MTMAEQVWTVAHPNLENRYPAEKESPVRPIQAPEVAHVRPTSHQPGDAISHGQRQAKHGDTLLYGSDTPLDTTSVSSTRNGSTTITSPYGDPEKSYTIAQDRLSMPRSHQKDPEKAAGSLRLPSNGRQRNMDAISLSHSADEPDGPQRVQEGNALKVLLFLSGPCVLLSIINAVWTCVAVVITLVTEPVRLCTKQCPFGRRLAGLLAPAIDLQFRGIFTPSPHHANQQAACRPFQLVVVLLMSPILSIGLMLVSWVVAVYWASSLVVGDPAGLDKRDDGEDTVLGLRKGWERWLMKGFREQ